MQMLFEMLEAGFCFCESTLQRCSRRSCQASAATSLPAGPAKNVAEPTSSPELSLPTSGQERISVSHLLGWRTSKAVPRSFAVRRQEAPQEQAGAGPRQGIQLSQVLGLRPRGGRRPDASAEAPEER